MKQKPSMRLNNIRMKTITDYKGLGELSFPFSEYTEEEDQAYYNDK